MTTPDPQTPLKMARLLIREAMRDGTIAAHTEAGQYAEWACSLLELAEGARGRGLDGPSVDGRGGDGDDSGNATATRAEPVAPRRTPSAVHSSHGYTWVPIEDLRRAEAERDELLQDAGKGAEEETSHAR